MSEKQNGKAALKKRCIYFDIRGLSALFIIWLNAIFRL